MTTNDKFLSPGGPGSVWRLWQWQWRSLDIPIGWGFGGPAIARNRDGRLEVFVQEIGGTMWHRWQRSQGGWSQWASPEGQPSGWFSELAVGAPADGRLVVFAVADPASGSSREAPKALGEPTAGL